MAELRIIIAAAAALCGGIFLLLGFSAARRRRRSGAASGRTGLFSIYGILFLAAGILIWWRGPAADDAGLLHDANRAQVIREPAGRDAPPTEPQPEERGVRADERARLKQDPVARLDTSGASHQQTTAAAPTYAEPPVSNIRRAKATIAPAEPPRQPALLEDRIYFAVVRAFDQVERLFMRYATPVYTADIVASVPEVREIRTERSFPSIEFQSADGAELTPQSRDRVRRFARHLQRNLEPRLLEIRAYVDGGHPAPLATVLSLARANAVRDLLVEEGVQARRLLAAPMDDELNRSRPAETWVMFVVHQ